MKTEKKTLMQSIRDGRMSRKMLFLVLMTTFMIGYGVYSAFAAPASAPVVDYTGETTAAVVDATVGDAGAASGCACCGGSGSQVEKPGSAIVSGDVQEITVQVNGAYDPNIIEVKKGIPLKLTFERHSNGGCDSQISIPDINVLADLPTDGRVTYTIPVPNEAGKTISFACGMNMIQGTINVVD